VGRPAQREAEGRVVPAAAARLPQVDPEEHRVPPVAAAVVVAAAGVPATSAAFHVLSRARRSRAGAAGQ
jgi:hypothetical protein